MSGVETQLRSIIATIAKISAGDFAVQDDLVTKFGVDSMQRIEILIEIEKAFGIAVPDEEANNLRTLTDFANMIEKYRGANK